MMINHIMCTLKILTVLCFTKQKLWFCRGCLQCFSGENILIKHKEDCLSINRIQSVEVEDGTIEFKNYFQQLPVPFKPYADFECNLRDVEIYEGSYSKKYHEHVPCSFAYQIVCIDDTINLVNRLLFIEAKMLLMNLLKQFLKNISTAKK